MKKLLLITGILALTAYCFGQNIIQPVGIGEKMGDFTLKTYQGEEVVFNAETGKNTLFVFPRGRVLPNLWCPLCYYQYAELAEANELKKLEETFDLKIYYVLSHPSDTIDDWCKNANKGLKSIEKWKYPKGDSLPEGVYVWANYVKEFFPQNYTFDSGEFELPIPILMDEKQTLVKGLQLLRDEWGGTKVEQTTPTIFLVDKTGTIVFKYHSQYTNDRANIEYLTEIMKKLL